MKKLSISKVIEFSRKPKKSQPTFLKQHNRSKPPSSGGGDYWISSISAVSHAFKNDDNSFVTNKIESLLVKVEKSTPKVTKDMFQRNIDILYNFENFNFSKWISNSRLTFIKKKSEHSIIQIKSIPIQVTPNHIFTYNENGETKIGAVSFVSKLGGYKKYELAAFADAIYRYLIVNYSEEYTIDSSLCLAVDMSNLNEVSYEDIRNEHVKSLLDITINDIQKAA